MIQKHHGRAARPVRDAVPVLTEPAHAPSPQMVAHVPVLLDVVDPAVMLEPAPPAEQTDQRQLEIALYIRLRRGLDQALADIASTVSDAGAAGEARKLIAEQLRTTLAIVVRDSLDQVLTTEAVARR